MLYDGCRGDTAWAESVKHYLQEIAKNTEERNKLFKEKNMLSKEKNMLLERIAKALEVKENIKEEEKNGKQ